jgi:hypothetical protein
LRPYISNRSDSIYLFRGEDPADKDIPVEPPIIPVEPEEPSGITEIWLDEALRNVSLFSWVTKGEIVEEKPVKPNIPLIAPPITPIIANFYTIFGVNYVKDNLINVLRRLAVIREATLDINNEDKSFNDIFTVKFLNGVENPYYIIDKNGNYTDNSVDLIHHYTGVYRYYKSIINKPLDELEEAFYTESNNIYEEFGYNVRETENFAVNYRILFEEILNGTLLKVRTELLVLIFEIMCRFTTYLGYDLNSDTIPTKGTVKMAKGVELMSLVGNNLYVLLDDRKTYVIYSLQENGLPIPGDNYETENYLADNTDFNALRHIYIQKLPEEVRHVQEEDGYLIVQIKSGKIYYTDIGRVDGRFVELTYPITTDATIKKIIPTSNYKFFILFEDGHLHVTDLYTTDVQYNNILGNFTDITDFYITKDRVYSIFTTKTNIFVIDSNGGTLFKIGSENIPANTVHQWEIGINPEDIKQILLESYTNSENTGGYYAIVTKNEEIHYKVISTFGEVFGTLTNITSYQTETTTINKVYPVHGGFIVESYYKDENSKKKYLYSKFYLDYYTKLISGDYAPTTISLDTIQNTLHIKKVTSVDDRSLFIGTDDGTLLFEGRNDYYFEHNGILDGLIGVGETMVRLPLTHDEILRFDFIPVENGLVILENSKIILNGKASFIGVANSPNDDNYGYIKPNSEIDWSILGEDREISEISVIYYDRLLTEMIKSKFFAFLYNLIENFSPETLTGDIYTLKQFVRVYKRYYKSDDSLKPLLNGLCDRLLAITTSYHARNSVEELLLASQSLFCHITMADLVIDADETAINGIIRTILLFMSFIGIIGEVSNPNMHSLMKTFGIVDEITMQKGEFKDINICLPRDSINSKGYKK